MVLKMLLSSLTDLGWHDFAQFDVPGGPLYTLLLPTGVPMGEQ